MDADRRFDVAATGGALGWLVVVALLALGSLEVAGPPTATLAVGLATLVVVPLVARLADLPHRDGRRSRSYRAAAVLTTPAAVALLVSLSLPTGVLAGLLAVPWLVVTGLLAGFGLRRTLPNTHSRAELAVGVGLCYLPVAGVALVTHRLGASVGFDGTTVLLTGVHFHYAGCVVPVFAGLLGRVTGERRPHRWLLVPVLLGPGVVGIGIARSPAVELVAAVGFALAVVGVALSTLRGVPELEGRGRALVGVAAVSVLVSMGLVVTYLATPWLASSPVGFETMLRGHGWLNAAGFALLGLVGWRLLDPGPAVSPLGLPLSRLTSRGRVGAEYLDRNGLRADVRGDGTPGADGGSSDAPTGMVDRFSAFDGPARESVRIHPDVGRFYERTAEYDLHVTPTWSPGFRLGSRLYARVGRRLEQMNFPVTGRDPARLSSRIVPVEDADDGRANVRAWVRTYDRTGAAIYVALYSTHELDGRPYMNIAFPLPGTNLTSVLSVEPLGVADPDGVELSTATGGDAGIYLRTPLGPLRLPMNETIRVWTPEMDVDPAVGGEGDPDADVEGDAGPVELVARHDVSLFGRRFLRLDYRMWRES